MKPLTMHELHDLRVSNLNTLRRRDYYGVSSYGPAYSLAWPEPTGQEWLSQEIARYTKKAFT